MSEVIIELLRHGDTGQRSYRGQLDDALSEQGWTQLREAVLGRQWDAVVSSPLQRCARFASELADLRGLPLRLDERLAEYHFGDWQGVPIETLAERDGDALGRFWADPVAYPPPGAESFTAFRGRLSTALDRIVAEAVARRVLVITHGGAIRLLRCLVEERDYCDMAGIDVLHASLHPLPWPPLPRLVEAM
ncbi:fructose-2,6-bisphosphatase [Rhodanobacter sp. FW510-R12]|uniref:histidine phosphatase family protein n=1 Tax=unclassified Rhodanobacter TaxID=2621553 RepID=UPI0007A9AFD6|nr:MULTISPECIES: histidine phosphatase family protein [unclassified Rhodanobacter]KZC15888.1 fructose-2,6-bisphosphatase [Rhodanobacter sp. FW104-R8]KZC28298.1 fructose-2,6-bisphosphatase [Rhodanobacter sp. FW510-T8]KZC32673.1 fructose-2,6-bisphosphatase [Rhodanobacter sp. FW510-R10]